jgi:hypothetical protein
VSKPGIWSWKFRANGTPKNLGERCGNVLRGIADKVDGRISVAMKIETTPKLDYNRIASCIQSGFKTIKQSLEHEVVLDATEDVFEVLNPELFEDEK